MVQKTTSTGAYGRWRIYITQESQSQSGNTSRVRVRGVLYNDGGSRSYNGGSISKSISGEDSWSGSGSIDVSGGGSQEIIDRTFTVPHNSNGYKTVTYYINCADTGTYNLGDPPKLGHSLTLDRIPKEPDKVSGLSRSFVSPNDMDLNWSAPDNNGSGINRYQVQWAKNSSFSSGVGSKYSSNRSTRVYNLDINDRWYFRVRAENDVGWGPWSNDVSYDIPDHPGKVGNLSLDYTPATTMKISFSAPSTGGATIQGYVMHYADNSNFNGYKRKEGGGSTRSFTVNDLEVGKTWYFRVLAQNSQGNGSWSNTASYLVVCGPRIKVDGEWRNTVAYVKINGVWETAIPYVKANGDWRVAGG